MTGTIATGIISLVVFVIIGAMKFGKSIWS